MDATDEQLNFIRGYDHSFVQNDSPKNEEETAFVWKHNTFTAAPIKVISTVIPEPGEEYPNATVRRSAGEISLCFPGDR